MADIVDNFSKYASKEDESSEKKILNKGILLIIIIVVIVVVYLILNSLFFSGSALENAYNSMSNSSGYQAVVLNDSNLNIYFGKVAGETNGSLYLTNVFYLKANSGASSSKVSSSQQYSLVHLTPTYSYGALDEMKINRSNVLFTENLSKQSSVYTAILNYYKTHK